MSAATQATTANAEAWLERYVDAWRTNAPADIAALFAADARYLPSPWQQPWSGRAEIVREWLARRDEPGTWRFDGRVLTVAGDLATIVGTTTYLAGADAPETSYANLWLVRLAEDGAARAFEEWWVVAPEGSPAGIRQKGEGA